MARRITGLQREVYKLYKRSLQMVLKKPLAFRSSWYQFVSAQFRDPALGGGVKRKDVTAIEYYLRRGEKMLDTYGAPAVRSVRVPSDTWWPEGWVVRGYRKEAGDV